MLRAARRFVHWLVARPPQEDVIGTLPYFPCYHQRWLASTAHLSLAAQGLYWRYLCWMADNGPLPLDERRRINIAGVPTREWRRLWGEFSEKFSERSDGYHNERLDDILRDVNAYRESQKSRANSRWAKARADATALPTAQPNRSHGSTRSGTESMLPISTKKRDLGSTTILPLREHQNSSTQDPPAAPEDAVEKLWKTDEPTELQTGVRDREEDLPAGGDDLGLGGSDEVPHRQGRIFTPPTGRTPDPRPIGRRSVDDGAPLTTAQAARELAQAILTPGQEVKKAEYCERVYSAAQSLPADAGTRDEVATHGWTIWTLYPEDFTLLNPREAPERQRVKRNR